MYRDEKKFTFILFISLAIHIALIMVLPGFKDVLIEESEEILQLKSGIEVQISSFEKPKKVDAEKENSDKRAEAAGENTAKNIEDIKKNEIKEIKNEKVVEKKDKNVLNFNEGINISEIKIDEPKFDFLASNSNSPLKVAKKDIRGIYRDAKIDNSTEKNNTALHRVEGELKQVKEVVPTLKDEVFKGNYNVSTKVGNEELKWINFKDESGTNNNLPEGFKLGTLEEGLVPIWSKSNMEPKYPLEAEKNGMKGKVTAILDVDETGSVRKVRIEKSGYSVLDKAVSEVANTWKIFIYQNGLPISGKVSVTYDFELIRKK